MVKIAKIEEEIEIPKGVTFTLEGKNASAKGKLGVVSKDFSHAKSIEMELKDNKITIRAYFPRKTTMALVNTIKFTLRNMFEGVLKGYTYKMKIIFVHFPITVEPVKNSDKILIKNFQGERAPRVTFTIGNVKVNATKEEVIVTGTDKENVGQTCANIQKKCRIRKKDKRIFQDGIYIYEKMLGDKQLWVIK